jgi:hypothetical protein
LRPVVRRERAENFDRKDFTWSEAVEIAQAVEPLEKAAAKERQLSGLKKGNESRPGKLPEREKGEARDRVAQATGMSAPGWSL